MKEIQEVSEVIDNEKKLAKFLTHFLRLQLSHGAQARGKKLFDRI